MSIFFQILVFPNPNPNPKGFDVTFREFLKKLKKIIDQKTVTNEMHAINPPPKKIFSTGFLF